MSILNLQRMMLRIVPLKSHTPLLRSTSRRAIRVISTPPAHHLYADLPSTRRLLYPPPTLETGRRPFPDYLPLAEHPRGVLQGNCILPRSWPCQAPKPGRR